MASATAIRPDAGPLINARGVRSPMAIASPAKLSSETVVMAQSDTGTCQGPTIWSLATIPVMVLSPMVIKKLLLATEGNCSTCSVASATEASSCKVL